MAKRTNIEELPGFHYLVHGRHGVFLANKNDIYVGGALITYGEFSELETDTFKRFVDKETTVIEIGANIGAHTVWLAKNAKRVIAIEPQPFIFYTLCSQIALNSLQNVECINSCVGFSGNGFIDIPSLDYSKPNNFGGLEMSAPSDERVRVRCETLDEIVQSRNITGKVFLKVDVEGMEEQVLRSGAHFIRDMQPVMYVENDRPEKSEGLVSYIKSMGYKLERDAPTLFNPNNFFKKKDNKFVNAQGNAFASFNEICTPILV
jgi:FkbM family methyltransferase